jgi:hypothetical protein
LEGEVNSTIFFYTVLDTHRVLQNSRIVTGKVVLEVETLTSIEGLLFQMDSLLHHKTKIGYLAIEHMLTISFQLKFPFRGVLVSLDTSCSINWLAENILPVYHESLFVSVVIHCFI